MKKLTIVLAVCCLLCAAKSYSQVKVRYQGDIEAGYSVGIGTFNIDRINFRFVNSARIGDYVSAGIGVGVDYYTGENADNDLSLPVYLNLRGYLPVSDGAELFLGTDIGASIGLSESMDGLKGLLFVPALGVRFKSGNKNAVSLSVGYHLQQWSESGFHINTDAIQFKLGFSF